MPGLNVGFHKCKPTIVKGMGGIGIIPEYFQYRSFYHEFGDSDTLLYKVCKTLQFKGNLLSVFSLLDSDMIPSFATGIGAKWNQADTI